MFVRECSLRMQSDNKHTLECYYYVRLEEINQGRNKGNLVTANYISSVTCFTEKVAFYWGFGGVACWFVSGFLGDNYLNM